MVKAAQFDIGFLLTGIFCQSFSSFPNEKCPGDNVTFTCMVMDTLGIGSTRWIVEGSSTVCVVLHNLPTTQTCGPNGAFTSSLDQSGVDFTTILSVSDDFNGTTVECRDQDLNRVGSEDICIVGESV